jgi:hypothetical protein
MTKIRLKIDKRNGRFLVSRNAPQNSFAYRSSEGWKKSKYTIER